MPALREVRMAEGLAAKRPPQDISEVYGMLRHTFWDLTDTMQAEVKEWMDELRAEFAAWVKHKGEEPNWEGYRQGMNEICRDDGMPSLFEEVRGDGSVRQGQGSDPGGV
jgi:hypothetical protein